MEIALLIIVLVAMVAIVVTVYALTKKKIILTVGEDIFTFKIKGDMMYIFLNQSQFNIRLPQLYYGEKFIAEIDGRQYQIYAKSNYFGNKVYIDMYDLDNNLLATNRKDGNTK